MKFNVLRDFLTVAERGSLRAAARQLGLTQPAMTRSIQELEKELGVVLFERRTKGIALTPMGQLFLRRAQSLSSELQRAREELAQARGEVHGHIRMCLSPAVHMTLLPQALNAFRRRFPDVKLQIQDAMLPRVQKELLDGTLDFYVGPASADISGELSTEKLFDNRRTIIARQGHPLAHAGSLRELQDAEWVTSSVTYNAEDELSPLFARHGLAPPRIVVHGFSSITYYYAIVESDLVMLLPVQWAQARLFRHSLCQIPVREHLDALPICIVRRLGLPLTPAADYFCDMVRRTTHHLSQEGLLPVPAPR